MNEVNNEVVRSAFKESAIRAGKILGGIVLGAASGYAMSKGLQEVIPVDSNFVSLHDTVVAATGALGGAGLASELSR